MPKGHESEDSTVVDPRSPLGVSLAAAKRDVNVSDDPAVEGAMPAAPEGEGGIVVRHAPDHVLRGVDAVE